MNTSNIYIVLLPIALLIGVGIGYLWFGQPTHNHEMSTAPASATAVASDQIWTCSMHPQIRQNEKGICPICEMDLIPLESNISDDPLVLKMSPEAVKLSNIQTTIVGQASNSEAVNPISLLGKVEADERRTTSLVTHIGGRVEQLFVTFTGEQVQAGQQLATIYAPELIAAQRELIEAKALQAVNPQLLEAVRNKLRYWKIGDQMIQNIEATEQIQETFTLYAEKSGTVIQKRVSVGDYIQKGAALFDVVDLSSVWVVFDAYEDDLKHISIGDQITFTAASIPNKTFKAKVTFIDPLVNPTTRTIAIRTEVNNKGQQLKPQLFVRGTIRSKTKKSSTIVSIPKTAVLWTGKESVVYVKLPDMEIPSFQFRIVELGDRIGDQYKIISGLENGDEVVTYGSFTIDAAAQLNNQASMMNQRVLIKKEMDNQTPNFQETTPIAFQEQLYMLTTSYFQLKDGLVATDALVAAEATKTVTASLDKIDTSGLESEASAFWGTQQSALKTHLQKIMESTEVEFQRQQFEFVSEALIQAIEAFGIIGAPVYVQYCPMALDNKGADWLSMEEAIRNPYFGDKMMKCGTVKRTIN